eukprot:m.135193 g.135193  ORF g.135193 m.135193 type:complete len:421 (+) comp16939_c1_seq4:118-1380(+)
MDKLKELDELLANLRTEASNSVSSSADSSRKTSTASRKTSTASSTTTPDPRASLAELNKLVASLPADATKPAEPTYEVIDPADCDKEEPVYAEPRLEGAYAQPSTEAEHPYSLPLAPPAVPPVAKQDSLASLEGNSTLQSLLQTLGGLSHGGAAPEENIYTQPFAPQQLKEVPVGTKPVQQPDGICAACHEAIVGASLAALDMEFHPAHFMCFECGKDISEAVYFENEGVPFCERCFHNKFSPRCGQCNDPIADEFVVAVGKQFHVSCFSCEQCNKVLDNGAGFVEHEGQAFCQRCYDAKVAEKCAACSAPIVEGAIQALDSSWHEQCFVCTVCKRPFPDGEFLDHGGKPFCAGCYHQQAGAVCAYCNQGIVGQCIVALGKRWHREHFRCTFCLQQLHNGTVMEHHGKPYCAACHVKEFG